MDEIVLNDSEYLNMMAKIDRLHFISDNKWDWEHGLGHAKRVTNYIKQILTYLKADSHTLELGMIAGLLHDIGLIDGKKNDHATISARLAKIYLSKYKMKPSDVEIIIQAISDHSNGNNIQSLVGASLLLADKLDNSKYRVLNSTVKDETNYQISNIDNITVSITATDIIINYITNGHFNPIALNDWGNKPVLIPFKVAKYLHKRLIFLIDGSIWNIDNILENS